MSEETDLLKSAVAHHGSTLAVVGSAYYDYRNAYNEACWAFKPGIPLAIQQACFKRLLRAAERFAGVLDGESEAVQPSGDEVLPASVD